MNKSIGRGLPRWLFGLALGITLALGIVPGIRTRVALAADTYTVTITNSASEEVYKNASASLNTEYSFSVTRPDPFHELSYINHSGCVASTSCNQSQNPLIIKFSVNDNSESGGIELCYLPASTGNRATLNWTVTCTKNPVPVTGVKVTPAEATIVVGRTQTLSASVEPEDATDRTVTWSSNNTSVATVSTDGTVTGVKAGKATITATTNDGKKTATCEVTVNEIPSAKPSDYHVSISSVSSTGGIGGTASASPTSGPTGTVVTLTAIPNAGCELDKWELISGEGAKLEGDKLTIGTSSVEVRVTFKKSDITYSATPTSATWTPGSEKGLVFTFRRSDEGKDDTTFDHFVSLSVDGSELIKDKAYTADKGSVVATLAPEFLDLLSAGNHTLTATFDDGSVDATLTVEDSTTYTIRFDANGGTGSMDPLVVEKEATTKLPKNTFTRLGYKFVEWNQEADGSGRSYSDEDNVKVLSNGILYAQWKKDYPAPTMSNSRGGTITSTSEEITFTVNQGVPDYTKSFVTWVDLEDVFSFSSDEVEVTTTDGGTVSSDVAKVSIDGQRLTITVDDATSLQGKTLQVSYKAKLKSGADLSSYATNGIASVPYQAHTIFDGNESDVKNSDVEYVKFRVSSSKSSNTTTSNTKTPTTSSKSSTLAKTSDPTSLAGAATMAAAGAVAIFAGRRKK